MALKYIDNVVILAEVDEEVNLPSTLLARRDDNSYTEVDVTWFPTSVDTSEEGEYIFVGKVDGYVHDILCSVQVGDIVDNPKSIFPEEIDDFGIPKKDIQTADIPDIDDYQYYKAKIPRTLTEEYQLKQLREMLADKIILARDVNHLRNAVIAIEEYCQELKDEIDALDDRLTALERRVDVIERTMVTDGENVGNGAEVFREKRNKKLQFRSLVGKGQANIFEDNNEVIVDVDAPVGCGHNVYGDTFQTCREGDDVYPIRIASDIVAFGRYFNFQMVKVKSNKPGTPYNNSLLGVFGAGDDEDVQQNAGRFLKGTENFIFEFKVSNNRYVGFEMGVNGYNPFDDSKSRVHEQLIEVNPYSRDVDADKIIAKSMKK